MYRELDRSMSGTERAVSSSALARSSRDSSSEGSRSEILTVEPKLSAEGVLENRELLEEVVTDALGVETTEVVTLWISGTETEAMGETDGSGKLAAMSAGILQMGLCAARMNSSLSFSLRRLAMSF